MLKQIPIDLDRDLIAGACHVVVGQNVTVRADDHAGTGRAIAQFDVGDGGLDPLSRPDERARKFRGRSALSRINRLGRSYLRGLFAEDRREQTQSQ